MYKYLSKNGQVLALVVGGLLAVIAAITLYSTKGENGFGIAAAIGLVIVTPSIL